MDVSKSDIEFHEQGEIGTFLIRRQTSGERAVVAEMAFQWQDGVMKILQTGIRPGHEDSNAGKRLVEAAVERAREKGFSIAPLCPFAQKVFDDASPAWDDVLA